MTKALIQKNIRLSSEFDNYISGNAKAFRSIPNGANIIITSSRDKALSDANISIARNSRNVKFIEAHKSDGGWKIRTFKK